MRYGVLGVSLLAAFAASVWANDAADAPLGGEQRFRKVFAFTDIGDDEHAAKLAELNVFAANCCDAANRPDPEKIARAKRFGIVPYVAFGPFCDSHVQVLSYEEARLQSELQSRFVASEAKGEAGDRGRTDLWRARHYRLGGEPEPGNTEVFVENVGCFVGTNACAKGAASLVERLKANPEAKAVCLDYIGYANYRGCRHPDCLRLLKAWLEREGLADTEENRDRFFEDQIVAYYAALYDAVKAYDPSIVVYAHIYPVFLPDPLYGSRLKLDYCAQTCAWYFRWSAEKVRKYAETVVRGQREHWPFAHGVPFVAYGPWANDIDPDFRKTPEDLDRELRAVLESGAEYLSVHEIDSIIADPVVFAVFKKYCADPSAHAVQFDAAEPVWTTAERGEVNSSVAFTTHFDWDGKAPLKLRLAGCSVFKVFVNGEFAAYGPARGPHGWFRMDEWDLSRVARKGDNRLSIVGVAYNTTTYYIVEQEPFLQAEVLSGGKVVRATGDGKWGANFTERVRKTQRYSLQRAQSEVYEVPRHDHWEWWKRDGFKSKSLIITNCPAVKLLERGAPYPKFEIDRTYSPTDVLSVKMRTGDLGEAPHLWDEKSSFLGRTYPSAELKYHPSVDWWKRTIEPKTKFEIGEAARVDASRGVCYEGAINDTGFLRLKVKVTKPGRLLVGFDEILVGDKLDFLKRFGCNNIVLWDVKEPGEYDFESFEPYTFKFAEVIMLEGEATVEKLELRTYKNPNATRTCTLADPADRKIFEAARETFAQNAVDVFTDCPSRERAGWLCDSYFTGPAEHFFTGKNEIERTFLRNFALAERFPYIPEGMVPMCYPGDHINKTFIPNWSMWFILELANYFDRTGDRETVDLLRPRVEGLLKFYAQYLNADGALENLPGWVFVEWSHANDTKLVKDGVNWPSNMTYAEVLSKAARLYERPELAEQSEKLKELIRERSYDGIWFRDNSKHPDVTETCQYYAFFHGIATPKTHPELWRRITDEFGPERQAKGLYKEVWPSNAFIGNLLRLIVLKSEGRDAQVSREIRGYYLKMAETTGTLWEHDRPEASCNHGFASYLAILLDETNK